MVSSLLSSHLEQISLCATSIAELQFAGPKIFTNALLAPHDITALIRDTEIHERALFSIAPPTVPTPFQFAAPLSGLASTTARPSTAYAQSAARQPRRNPAVAAVLGGDLYRKIRNVGDESDTPARYGRARDKERGDLDVDLLLEGAEKLCNVYPIAGAADRIAALRSRHQQLSANIAHYEDRVARNATQLDIQRKGYENDADMANEETDAVLPPPRMTREDVVREEEDIRELEHKKRALEERVTGMEKDLGGLMR